MEIIANVPTSMDEITVEQFVSLKRMELKQDVSIIYKTLGILCGLRVKEIKQLPLSEVEYIFTRATNFMNEESPEVLSFELNGIKFGRIPNLDKISFGEFLDLETYFEPIIKGFKPDFDLIYNIMAVMFRPEIKRKGDKYNIEPYTGSEKYSELMKLAPASAYKSAEVFFCGLSYELLNYSKICLAEQVEQQAKPAKISEPNGVGTGPLLSLLTGSLAKLKKQKKETLLRPFSFWIFEQGKKELLTLKTV